MMAEQIAFDYSKPLTLSERCDYFMRDNPQIIGLIEDMIEKMIREGKTRIAIAKVVEDLRADTDFVTKRGHSSFKFNNDFRSRYADAIVARHPEWDSIIERRARKAA